MTILQKAPSTGSVSRARRPRRVQVAPGQTVRADEISDLLAAFDEATRVERVPYVIREQIDNGTDSNPEPEADQNSRWTELARTTAAHQVEIVDDQDTTIGYSVVQRVTSLTMQNDATGQVEVWTLNPPITPPP